MNHEHMKETKLLKDFLLFFILVFVIGFLQCLLLGLVLKYGFTPDDWGLLLFYKTLGDNPLSKIAYVWSIKGAYTTSQVYFIGILNSFFGLNYSAYQITNIILKILATLSLFPLILIVFKNRTLAFLTTFLYGISYMASRSLEYVVKGTDYLAIIPMNIFFIIYYYIMKKKVRGFWLFIFMSFFWFISLMISPIRIYPILILVPLIELCLWLQHRSRGSVIQSSKRLLILYLPFLLIYFYKPVSILGFLQNPPAIYHAIVAGNWHILLTPFQGVGLTLLTNGFWSNLINNLNLAEIGAYLSFLVRGPFVVFGFFILILASIKSQKPARFFSRAFFLNFLLDIIFYYLAIHELSVAENLRLHFDPARMYPILVSSFMLAISFASFLEWKDYGRKDNLLLALWISSPIALLYTFLIWLLAPFGVGFEGQQGYYLVVPAIASSLFLAAIFVAILDKTIKMKSRMFRLIVVCGVVVSLFYIYTLYKDDIYYFFNSAGINGRYGVDQDRMFTQVLNNLNNFNFTENNLFYFDVSEDAKRGTFYTETLLLNLAVRLHIANGGVTDGCTGVFYEDISSLAKLVSIKDGKDGKDGFISQGLCVKNGQGRNAGGIFYKINNFYAFRVKNGGLTNIKPEVVRRLGIRQIQ